MRLPTILTTDDGVDAYCITLDVPCSACDGIGIVPNPQAPIFWEKHNKHDGKLLRSGEFCPECDAYAQEEEGGCGECDASGRILTTNGQTLATFMRSLA